MQRSHNLNAHWNETKKALTVETLFFSVLTNLLGYNKPSTDLMIEADLDPPLIGLCLGKERY